MNERPILQRPWVRWGLFLGIWTLLGIFDISLTLMNFAYHRKHLPALWKVLSSCVADWYFWAALTPLILRMAHRYPFQQNAWLRPLFLHIFLSILFMLLVVEFDVFFLFLIDWPQDKLTSLTALWLNFFFWKFHLYVLVYWGIFGLWSALDFYGKYRQHERQALQLEARLAQAQLQVLKMQLHPHFLFNTLHTISALMHQDVEVADRMLARLGALLRSALENTGTHEVRLGQELEFVQPYLEIEQARLGERLKIKLDIDPDTMDAFVPNLILQPLVENAIRHGIAPYSTTGRIEIRSRREQDCLRLEVRDNGPGLPPEQGHNLKPGVGLSNTRARLRQLYGDAHHFAMSNHSRGGLVVTLVLPFHESARIKERPPPLDDLPYARARSLTCTNS
jgi:signal transduction histidine kinase